MYRRCIAAWLFACCCLLLLPATASAHSSLERSNPTMGAVLKNAPTQVQMWFSEDLNPTFTTAYVVNVEKSTMESLDSKSTHVDLGDVHVASNNPREIDLSLKSNLAPAVYLVFYRTQSTVDGHILEDSFFFTIERPDGTVPTFSGSLPVPPLTTDASETTVETPIDASKLFSALMITLIDMGLVFWLGAQLWRVFVFELTETTDKQLRAIYAASTQRFETLFAQPVLWTLLLAHIGILVGQALVIIAGNAQAFTFSLLSAQVLHGQFGHYWMLREGTIALALLLNAIGTYWRKAPSWLASLLPWLNLLLGVVLLVAITLSGHAAAVDSTLFTSSVLIGGMHLLAAALWVGGMFYLATTFLPIVKGKTSQERTWALLSTLPHYAPLACIGVVIMATSGVSNADIRLPGWSQLFTTEYGYALLAKITLVAGLLITSAIHVFWLRPRLKKTYFHYAQTALIIHTGANILRSDLLIALLPQLARQEERLHRECLTLIRTLRWEPLLGVAVLLCTGLLTVFSGTLHPAVASQNDILAAQGQNIANTSLETKIQTTDGEFGLTLNVSPNHQGFNAFTLHILKQPGTTQNVSSVVLYTTIPGMDMHTDVVQLQPDALGNFSGGGIFSMPGRWQIRIELYTIDKQVHNAQLRLLAP